jgi:hypothetical protein
MSERERPNNGWLFGLYFGLGIHPVRYLLSHLFSYPVAFSLAVFLMYLLAYPLFFRGKPRYWSWMRNWGFWQFALSSFVIAIIIFFVSHAFSTNG